MPDIWIGALGMQSALYFGSVHHQRYSPVQNSFQYRLFFVYLDLWELDRVFESNPLWSVEKKNLAAFFRRDHFGDPGKPLEAEVKNLVYEQTGEMPKGPVRVLCHLRYWGYIFNPVCFYYCFDEKGENLTHLVAEVSNTPWLQRHQYVFGPEDNRHTSPKHFRYLFSKAFHVSPFMEMEIRYNWHFSCPGETLNVHMINEFEGGKRFDATLRLKRREITGKSLSNALMVHPFMTGKVVAAIYWQALKLKIKGARFYPHPDQESQKILFKG